MVEVLEHKKALEYLNKYFDQLAQFGYAKPGTTSRYLLYVFLVDFVDTLYRFFSEDDYCKVDDVLSSLFSGGDCLLSYPLFCTVMAKLGEPQYMGAGSIRVTETGKHPRETEDDKLRGI